MEGVTGRRFWSREEKRAIVAELLRNPLLLSLALGCGVNLLQIPVPFVIATAAAMLGHGALPLLLLSMGAALRFSASRCL